MNRNPYIAGGAGLVAAGAWLALVSFLLLDVTPLTALGVGAIIVGMVLVVAGRAYAHTTATLNHILMETGAATLGMLIEELSLTTKAVYLPSSLAGGEPRALIPLHANPAFPGVSSPLPRRLIVKYGERPDDMGLLVTTPGAAALRLLPASPEPAVDQIEGALTSLLVGYLNVVRSVKVYREDGSITVDLSHCTPGLENFPAKAIFGSLLASIVATVAAEGLQQAVVVKEEEQRARRHIIKLEILP